jgi:hypothetical protein
MKPLKEKIPHLKRSVGWGGFKRYCGDASMIKDDIQQRILTALKEGKKTELKVLRYISSQIKYEEINKQKELTDEETVTLLQKELKKREEAIEMFKKGKRDDLVADEEKQLIVIRGYLPKQLSADELNKIIDEVISASSQETNMGKIIGLVMAKVKGRTSGAIVANLVKQKLNLP